VLAHILRTAAHLHRPLPADSPAARAIEVLARAHQDLVWSRQREVNRLRSLLAGYYPAALAAFGDLTTRTAMTVLATAPTPAAAAQLSTSDLLDLLAAAGRGRHRAEARRLAEVFAAPQMRQPAEVEQAMGDAATAVITTITAMNTAAPRWPSASTQVLSNTRTLRSTTACLRSVRSSAPGCPASRRRPNPLARSCPPPRLRRKRPHHPRLRQETRGAGPQYPQPPAL
jgi:Transposase